MQTETDDKEATLKKYMVDVMINPLCVDEDGPECPCQKKSTKQEYNPV